MCGISGYVGNKNASEVVLGALEKLSYRGYDSAGISVLTDGIPKIATEKCKGRISALRQRVSENPLPPSSAAIGHTRWATHGAVTDANSHPHGTDKVTLVHNGIIENHRLIKERLTALGYTFKSETDTECAALLADYFYSKLGEPLSALRETASGLQGSFALAVMFADVPNTVFAMRKESPLLIGLGDGETFIASDIPAFLSCTKKYFRLADYEIAKIDLSGVRVYNKRLEEVSRSAETASFDEAAAEKGGFEHFMRKEISEEVAIVTRLYSIFTDGNGLPQIPKLDTERIKNSRRITVVGCGTAYHAGLYLRFLLRKLARTDADCEIASEFRYSGPLLDKSDTVIFISQSGETADTLSCLRMAKAAGAYTVGIVNAVGSSLASEADTAIYTYAGMEIAVASTKAYTAQCTVAVALAVHIARILGKISDEKAKGYALDIKKLPELIGSSIGQEDIIKDAAREISDAEHIFFIGRQADYIAALEGSLKLKEISYIHSECYPAGELKHGTISLITESTPVIALISDRKMKKKTLSNLKEVAARGAKTVAVSPLDEDVAAVADVIISIPYSESIVTPIAIGSTLQLLAYHAAKKRGSDIDQPRNLAKSVTVE